jgi:hypothetical protein
MIETDRTRLIRLLKMFSSNFDGEVASAARRAHQLIESRRLDWDELIIKVGAAGSSKERREHRAHATGPIGDIRRCQPLAEHLTEWEADFIESIAGSILEWGRLTPRQRAVLDRVVNKLKLGGLWEGAAW